MAALLPADFFTPIVDDAYDFGRIAAANALSDIYAMGGRPLCALNLVALPGDLPSQVAIDLVLGIVHPDRVVRNIGARPGDAIVLTKPIGTGIMTTALKRGLEDEDSVRIVIESMASLNAAAADAMVEVGVQAATDVTGFGLVGHLREMAEGSGVAAVLDRDGVPLFERVMGYAADLVCPGRTKDLLAYLAPTTDWTDCGPEWRAVLTDPQTSGGLLMAVDQRDEPRLMAALEERGQQGHVVGRFEAGEPGHVTVV